MKLSLREHKEAMMSLLKVKTLPRIVMPQPEIVFEKRNLYKQCKQQSLSSAQT